MGSNRLSGIAAVAGALPRCSTEARARRVVCVLVKGMWCEGTSSRLLSLQYGWVLEPRVLGAAPGAHRTHRRRGKGVQAVPRSHHLPWAEVRGIFPQGSSP